jgi:hypothetical protein
MKKQHFKLLSLSLTMILLMSLTIGDVKAQGLKPASDPLNEALGIKRNSELDIEICDPTAGPFSLEITNPYFPLPVGQVWLFKGVEDGVNLRLRITVFNETEVVAGVTTRVVEEREWEDGELIEVSRNFFVQAQDGTVCYYGENVDIYENGQVVSHEGAWRAGEDDNLPGIIMPANPTEGMSYAQEVAPGIAEDRAEIVSIGETVTVPAGTFENTLHTRETTPLEPGNVSLKHYAPGVGLIVDSAFELVRVGSAANDDDGDNDNGNDDDGTDDDNSGDNDNDQDNEDESSNEGE